MTSHGYNKIYGCEDKLFPTNCFTCIGKDKCTKYRYGSNEDLKDIIARIDDPQIKDLK